MSKHSAGPWRWDDSVIGRESLVDSQGGHVLRLDDDWAGTFGNDIDGRLIAAAPELLEVARMHSVMYCDTEHVGSASLPKSRACGACSVCKARALIRRIEGGE